MTNRVSDEEDGDYSVLKLIPIEFRIGFGNDDGNGKEAVGEKAIKTYDTIMEEGYLDVSLW